MKHSIKSLTLVLMALVMSVAFSSCGKDDEPVTPTTTSIVGTWVANDYTVNGISNTTVELVIRKDGSGQIMAKYPNGVDPDIYKFEYELKTDSDGDLAIKFVFTGTSYLVYEPGHTYYPTVTTNRLILGGIEYVRK